MVGFKDFFTRRNGFTLSELLIALLVIGVLVAIIYPVVVKIMPDQNAIMAKKVYTQTQVIISEMLNDSDCYPQNSKYLGLDDGTKYEKCLKWQGNEEGDAREKFVTIFSSYLDVKKGSLQHDGNSATFQTKDGMVWKLSHLERLQGEGNINNPRAYITLSVDVNGISKDPNCGQSNKSGISDIKCGASIERGFDNMTMLIHQNGKIIVDDCWAVLAVKVDKKLHGDDDDLSNCSSLADDEEEGYENISLVDCTALPDMPNPNHECCDKSLHPGSQWEEKGKCDACFPVDSAHANEECCTKWNSHTDVYGELSDSIKELCCSYVSSMCTGAPCLLEHPDGTCLAATSVKNPNPIKPSVYCDENNQVEIQYKLLGITQCCTNDNCKDNGDYWVGAVKMCADQGMRLPTKDELLKLAQYLYNNDTLTSTNATGLTLDTTKIPESLSGLGSGNFWSNEAMNANYAYTRYFTSSSTRNNYNNRSYSSARVICVPNSNNTIIPPGGHNGGASD